MDLFPHCREPETAFTLIELLVVIASSALLAAMLMPARAKQGGCRVVDLNNWKQFGGTLNLVVRYN
jgi:Tfp pilus assembly protein FimT